MCDCKIAWIEDNAVAGTHNSVPVRCSTYIAALEELVIALTSKYAPDSAVLDACQKAHGVKRAEKNP